VAAHAGCWPLLFAIPCTRIPRAPSSGGGEASSLGRSRSSTWWPSVMEDGRGVLLLGSDNDGDGEMALVRYSSSAAAARPSIFSPPSC
jgi:hypothetical protein